MQSSTGWFCHRIPHAVAVAGAGTVGQWTLGEMGINQSFSMSGGPLHAVCLHGLACASSQHGGLWVVMLLKQWPMALMQNLANQVESAPGFMT